MVFIKVVITLAIICFVSLWSRAGNPHHHIIGPAGPQGPEGAIGPSGKDGDSSDGNINLNVGVSARWLDAERWGLSSGYRYDIHHSGHIIDLAVLNLKIGKSYQDERIQRLRNELDTWKALVLKMSESIPNPTEPPVRATIKGSGR